jgi:hypothetical protein
VNAIGHVSSRFVAALRNFSRGLRQRVLGRGWAVVRGWSLAIALFGAAWVLLGIFGEHYPLKHWLLPRYLTCWLATAVFCLSAFSIGRLIVRLLTAGAELDGKGVVSFCTGVFVFFLAMFGVGLAGGLGWVAFILVPIALFLPGARGLYREVRTALSQRDELSFTRGEALAFGAGAIALFLVYLPTLVPEHTAYDSRWYHLALAEHYVAEGAIRRFPEGPVLATVPHLASVLYTWAFLLPGGELFDRIELAAHLEFACFLGTLAGIPPLVRHLVPGARARVAWVALFLFPAIFLYDASLVVAADHVAALFSVPAYLCMTWAWRELKPGACLLLAVQLCGLVMTKYTAGAVVVFPVLAVFVRSLMLLWSSLRKRTASRNWLYGPLVATLGGLLLSAPHWLKNLLWYGDPFYPVLHRHLEVRPWTPDGAQIFRVYQSQAWGPTGTALDKLQGTLRALYDYSLAVYNWPYFHKTFPIVGSLFTFALVALPFLGKATRIWALVVGTHLSIAAWYLLAHHDRYLQPLVPWMAAGVAAMAIAAWRLGIPARVGVLALAGVQLVWGLEMPFWPVHQMTGKSGIGTANDFFGRTFALDFTSRTKPFEDFAPIGRALPEGSKVLLNREHVHLGIGVMTVTDAQRIQYGINYGRLGSSRALHELLKEYGVTHVAWMPQRVYGEDSLAGELVFHTYANLYLQDGRMFGSRRLAAVPKRKPRRERPEVFNYGCDGYLMSGLYRLEDLHVLPLRMPDDPPATFPPPRVPLGANAEELIARADRVVIDTRCPGAPSLHSFLQIATWGTKTLHARRMGSEH